MKKIEKIKRKLHKKMVLYTKRLKRLKGKIKRFFNEFILFPICAFFRICHLPPFYSKYKMIPKLKDRHKGERCFIVATGPSLTVDDVESLRDEITFSVNSIDRIYSKTDWRPTYYAICDGRVYREKLSPEHEVPLNDYCLREAFVSHKIKPDIVNNTKADHVIYIPCCFLDNSFKRDVLHLKFTPNLLWGYYDSSTVVNFCMEIAQYMGIKEIYLLGVDCNYTGPKQYFDDRVDDHIEGQNDALRQQERMMTGYRFMKDNLEKLDIKVYNATRGGLLEVFERVNLDEVLNKKREDTEEQK